MPYNPDQHHRRSIRLPGYDYSQSGAYFVTICTHERECLFGDVVDGQMHLNAYGDIVEEEWQRSAEMRREIELDAWIVMPNHFHAIVFIVKGTQNSQSTRRGARPCAPTASESDFRVRPKSLASLVRGFKSAVKIRVNQLRDTPGLPLWQRNYYEHVIRDEDDLARIREYIANNPANWSDDENHPARLTPPS